MQITELTLCELKKLYEKKEVKASYSLVLLSFFYKSESRGIRKNSGDTEHW